MSNSTLIFCDSIDKEVACISDLVDNPVIIDTPSFSSIFLTNCIYIANKSFSSKIDIKPLLPNPSSVGSIYWRSINPLLFLSSSHGPVNGMASVNLILSQYKSARWFNSPKCFWSHVNKPLQLEKIRKIGIKIPETLYTSSREIAKTFINEI